MDELSAAVLADLLAGHHGLATRQDLLRRLPVAVVDGAVARGHLRRVFPHVYTARGNPATADRRLHAALLSVGADAVISHTTALAVHGVGDHAGPVHVTIDHSRQRVGSGDLRVHRRRGLDDDPDAVQEVRGLRVTPLAAGLVDSWPMLPRVSRRPTLIEAVRRTRLDPQSLAEAARRRPNIGGHRQLAQAIDLVGNGVESELEALGVLGVFRHRSLPRSRGQLPVVCPDGVTRRLDRVWEEAMLAVELDGAAFHTSPDDRRRDLERDALLAAMGWLVLRFTYEEVRRDPERVRAKVLAVYTARMLQLHAA